MEKVYVPALIFGQLLTSSNYDDDEKKVTGRIIGNIFYSTVKRPNLHHTWNLMFPRSFVENSIYP